MSGVYGLLGRKLVHSFSPEIHSYFYSAPYKLFEIEPENVKSFMQRAEFSAINVTIPYKQTVIPYCSVLSETAKKIGSVNTIVRTKDGSLYGDNTDYYGFTYLVNTSGMDIKEKKVLVLGSGGSSRTVQHVLHDLGASQIIVISRSGENNYTNIQQHYNADILVNTTPVGMYPNNGASVVDLSCFPRCAAVFDLIYNPAKTQLLLDAEHLKIPAFNGLPMLVAQAKKSAELFLGTSIPDRLIDDITDKLTRKTQNIILIGMPGCGKTTIGKALSAVLGREFLDTDTLIETQTSQSIPSIIQSQGEPAFRKIETDVLKDISKQSGKVIATGGGIVTQPVNYNLLKQNSVVIYLKRNLKELSTDGRPLSQANIPELLFAQRSALYEKYSDIQIEMHSIQETVDEIKERLAL